MPLDSSSIFPKALFFKIVLNINSKSLQEIYAPKGICYGCGIKNKKGLGIRSFIGQDVITASFNPEKYHSAFPGILNGGIIGSILDCHSNWAAAYYLMKSKNMNSTPCTVTARYQIDLHKPTPIDEELEISAYLDKIEDNKAWINAKITINTIAYASCKGLFVAVKDNHPAYHRW